MESKKDNNYKVAFFTLVGMIVGAAIVSCIFIFNGKNNTKVESSSNKVESKEVGKEVIKEDNNSNDNKEVVEEIKDIEYSSNENITSNKKDDSNKTSNVVSNKNTSNKTTANTYSEKDSKVINYLKEKEEKINSSLTKENAKSVFIEVVDFLFYNGEIKGYTFDELTEKGKVEVSELCSKIEIAIEKKYPGAIDETKSKYSEKKEKIIEKYNESINKFCTGREDTCSEFRKGYENMKSSFKKTFSVIKDIGSKGKEKFDNWYTNFKNKE